jgi:HEAT repeat protein
MFKGVVIQLLLCLSITCGVESSLAQQDQAKKSPDVSALIQKLDAKDEGVCRGALHALREIGPDAKAAIPAIADLLKAKSALVRVEASYALKKVDPETKLALPVLLEAFRVKDDTVRCYAAVAFQAFGVEAVAPLIELFKDPDTSFWPSSAVAMIGKPAIPLLKEALKDKNPLVQSSAKSALEGIKLWGK